MALLRVCQVQDWVDELPMNHELVDDTCLSPLEVVWTGLGVLYQVCAGATEPVPLHRRSDAGSVHTVAAWAACVDDGYASVLQG